MKLEVKNIKSAVLLVEQKTNRIEDVAQLIKEDVAYFGKKLDVLFHTVGENTENSKEK